MAVPHPSLARLASDVLWLRDHGVAPSRIADAFGVPSGRVRTLLHRQRERATSREDPLTHLLHFRHDDQVVAPSGRVRDELNALSESIRQIRATFGGRHDASAAIRALNVVVPQFGFAARPHLRRVEAELYRTRAWFRTNAGLSRSAWLDASRAASITRRVMDSSNSSTRADLLDWIEASRYRAHALTLAREPERALKVLDGIAAAGAWGSVDLGAEHSRLIGVVHFQLGNDHEATTAFETAYRLARDSTNYSHSVQPAMTGLRHLAVLREDCDAALMILKAAKDFYGPESLEASMTAHWYSASAFSTDSIEHRRLALEILEANRDASIQFGHQASVWVAMRATEQLGLETPTRREWVRRALYANAVSAK